MFVAETVGTAILILLGNGVVANQVLKETKGNDTGWMLITTGWGVAVALAVYSVGSISGAHLNPAVTFGLLAIGEFDASLVPTYIGGQMLGAIIGATLVWISYLPHWAKTEEPADKLACFATAPAIRSTGSNFVCELIGTAMLVFGVLAIGANAAQMQGEIDLSVVFSGGIQPLLVGVIVFGIGMSLGGHTGYAINPARDLGPRIAHAILPIAGKGSSDWGYAWIPVLGPIAGGVVGALLYQFTLGS